MASKIIKPALFGKSIRSMLEKHKDLTIAKSNKALRVATIKTWGLVIEETPVDEGRARGNWFVTKDSPSTQTGSKKKNKGTNYVRTSTGRVMFGVKWFLTNNLPYIKKLEYGGFTKKSETEKTIGGYSKLAPKGMVRKNLIKWPRILRAAFRGVAK